MLTITLLPTALFQPPPLADVTWHHSKYCHFISENKWWKQLPLLVTMSSTASQSSSASFSTSCKATYRPFVSPISKWETQQQQTFQDPIWHSVQSQSVLWFCHPPPLGHFWLAYNFLLAAFCTHESWLTAARQTGDILSTAIFKAFHPPPHTTGTNADIFKYKADQQYSKPNSSPLQEIQSQHGDKTKCPRQLFS